MRPSVFLRKEKKYLITPEQREMLLKAAGGKLVPDEYPEGLVTSVYLDTPDFSMIRRSSEASDKGLTCREKLRVRCYGEADEDSEVFFEIKKKYLGTVSKRRISANINDIRAYLGGGPLPEKSRIMSELDHTMRKNGQPRPVMLIAYDRQAYMSPNDAALRVTFDSSIRFRTDDLDPGLGTSGKRLLPPGTLLMEIKSFGFMPLWLAKDLGRCGIRPVSFSKVGKAYTLMKQESEERKCSINSLQSNREVEHCEKVQKNDRMRPLRRFGPGPSQRLRGVGHQY